jgi:hypothetical protein
MRMGMVVLRYPDAHSQSCHSGIKSLPISIQAVWNNILATEAANERIRFNEQRGNEVGMARCVGLARCRKMSGNGQAKRPSKALTNDIPQHSSSSVCLYFLGGEEYRKWACTCNVSQNRPVSHETQVFNLFRAFSAGNDFILQQVSRPGLRRCGMCKQTGQTGQTIALLPRVIRRVASMKTTPYKK